ncbi:MAG: S8 family serine peptidase [Chloroflexota bacterium]|nr:S8 family serine peptidase [Dehalococcoidia bacterium]MDW8253707.1 S8 family serine peptidase [Chloroflexota bacterium]
MQFGRLIGRAVAAIAVGMLVFSAREGGSGAAQSLGPHLRLERERFDPLAARPSPSEEGTTTWLVQFTGPVREEWKEAARAAGAHLAFYLPDHAFLTQMDAATAERVRALPHVRWVGPWHPRFRLAKSVSETAATLYDVQTFSGIDLSALSAAVAQLGGLVLAAVDNGFAGYLRVQIAPGTVAALAALDGVVWVEPHEVPHVLNDRAAAVLRAPEVWHELGLTGEGQLIAIADTGLDTGDLASIHPDFAGRVVKTYCLSRPDPCNWGDEHGHGTHVAGSALGSGVASGARPAEGRYAGSAAGIAPRAGIVVQAIGGVGNTLSAPADVGDLVRLAARDGAFIHSNSWGGGSDSAYRVNAQQIDYALWQERAALALFAAGNSGRDRDRSGRIDLRSLASPGTAKNVLTVGASENNRPETRLTYGLLNPLLWPVPPIATDPIANRIDGIAAFSSRGPTADGRLKPDVVAPGTQVFSTFSRLSPLRGATSATSYAFSSGTSMATPLVAGAAALVREWLHVQRRIDLPSGALLKALVINGAEDIAPGQYGTDPAVQEIPFLRPNPVAGFGRVNVRSSLAPTGLDLWLADETHGLATGETWEATIFTTGPGPLRVTLAWSDFPGQPGAATVLVNDLDLEVRGPDALLHLGNAGAYPPGDPCLRGRADACNTVESVFLPQAPPGRYHLSVRAYTVPQGARQPFALVVAGVGVGAGPGQRTPLQPPPPPARGQDCGGQQGSGVYLYDQPAFAGKCAFFTADAPDADHWHIGNDAAQSLRIVGNLSVILWSDRAFQGRAMPLTGPIAVPDLATLPCAVHCIGPKEVSSLQVRSNGVPLEPPVSGSGDPRLPSGLLVPGNCDGNAGLYLYSEPNFGGKCTRIMLGDPPWYSGNANAWHIGNDAAQSLRLVPRGRTLDDGRFEPASGLRATLYRDLFFGGAWTQITSTLLELPDLAVPPPGYSGPWIGAKTVSSARLEIVQLPAAGSLSTSVVGGESVTTWLPLVASRSFGP